MTYRMRPFEDRDYPALLPLAHAAVPWDANGNRRWRLNRELFAQSGRARRQRVVEDAAGGVVAYGAVEQQAIDPRMYRLFLVTPRDGLENGIADLLFERLVTDLDELDAGAVFMMEYLRDRPFLDFLQSRGFAIMPARTFSEWRLSLAQLDPAAAREVIERLDAQGLELVTLTAERDRSPDCFPRLVGLYNAVLEHPTTVEHLKARLEAPDVPRSCFIIAHADGRYVAFSGVALDIEAGFLVESWTGVHADYRQRGIAAALRMRVALEARALGFQGIFAYARAADPAMQALNESTGYRRLFDYVVLEMHPAG